MFKNSYFPRTIVEWNLLSPSTVGASSLDSFKERLQIDVQKLGVTGLSVQYNQLLPRRVPAKLVRYAERRLYRLYT